MCQVMRIIAMRAMSYENPQDNPQDNLRDNPQVYKQIQIQIQKLNNIQIDFYNSLAKAQDESARDYIASITNGRKGGRPKGKKHKNQIENQNANQFENQVEKTGQVDHQVDHQVELFEDFWSKYTPIRTSDGFVAKGNKQLAQKAFKKALKGASYETIIRGLQQYLTFCRENNRYTKQASTWLNKRGWEDDYGSSQAIQAEGRRGGSSFLNAMRDFLADDSIQ